MADQKFRHQALSDLKQLITMLDNNEAPDQLLLLSMNHMINLTGSRYAVLLHSDSNNQISALWQESEHFPTTGSNSPYLIDDRVKKWLLPALRRNSPLIANHQGHMKMIFDDPNACSFFHRLLLIPLTSTTGERKGLLAMADKATDYALRHIASLEPYLAFVMNVLLFEPLPGYEETVSSPHNNSDKSNKPDTASPSDKEYEDEHFHYSNHARLITDIDGYILMANQAAASLLALPSESLTGQAVTRLIPQIKLNLHPGNIPDNYHEKYQELKAFTRNGKEIPVRVTCESRLNESDLSFCITVQDISKELESVTQRQERILRIQHQQRSTLEVARLSTLGAEPFENLAHQICHITARTMNAPRVGIWLTEDDSPLFRNYCQTESHNAPYSECQPLVLTHKSPFARQLEQIRVMALTNLTEPHQQPDFLSKDYFKRHKINTLMCAAIVKESHLMGFLVIEDFDRLQWYDDQYNFAREVANYLHILILNEHRQRIQDALVIQEQQFRLLFYDSPMAMMAVDKDSFEFVAVNHAATEEFGYSQKEMLGSSIYDLIPIECVMGVHSLILSQGDNQEYSLLETRMKKHSGDIIDVEVHTHSIELAGKPSSLLVVHDITEKKRMEQSLRQTQKMEAVGQLVGGIAHDLNNITNIIRGHAELLELKLSDQEKIAKHIKAINKASDRTTSLTRKLMQFSRQQQINSQTYDTTEIIGDLIELITKSLTSNIEVVLNLAPDNWPVIIDKGDFEDVIINLAINARDAMDGKGTLTISTQNFSLVPGDPLLVRGREAGDYLKVSVRDTGSGIPSDIIDRIFDPFFTTKEKGKGTGLGLSMVYGFVKRSNGFMEVESRDNQGSCFHLWLPRSDQGVSQENDELSDTPDIHLNKPLPALVVDDEEDIRSSLSETLEHMGFEVSQAESADAAVQLLQNRKRSFSLMVSDIVMPGSQNGVWLAQWVKQHHPDTRIILASGYAENIQVADARKASCELLKKPFSRPELVRTLSRWSWT